MDLLVACGDPETFRFDPAWLRATAPSRWERAEVAEPLPDVAALEELEVLVTGADGTLESEISVQPGGAGIGLDCRTAAAAADVLAWLASAPGVPADGSVTVIHWQDHAYPLLPGATVERLLADYEE